jgi:c-di-GMP-binding flagellar brake protein YcgR
MQDHRRHKRFKLDLIEINGKMRFANKVEIIDISFGGVALKADSRLNIGREYLIRLGDEENRLDVKGVVIRSELSGIEERANGERVTIYTAGIRFQDGSADKIADFFHNAIARDKKEKVEMMVDRRINVRFQITAPWEKILSFPAQFRMKEISLTGMRIEADQSLRRRSIIPLELSLKPDSPVFFTGRIASCRMMEGKEHAHYEIGVEFLDLTDKDKKLLKTFIDYLAATRVNAEGGKNG